jgi:hypothetical protein
MANKLATIKLHRGNWTGQEQSEINRIRAACRAQPHLELDIGQTDEGEPWCAVYDRECDQVVVHFARIGRRYIVARSNRSIIAKTVTVAAGVDLALREFARGARQCLHDHTSSPTLPRPLVGPRT